MQTLKRQPITTPQSMTCSELVWEDLTLAATIEAAVQQVAAAYAFQRHPYLMWMQVDSKSRDAFRNSQLSFQFAVESFPRHLQQCYLTFLSWNSEGR